MKSTSFHRSSPDRFGILLLLGALLAVQPLSSCGGSGGAGADSDGSSNSSAYGDEGENGISALYGYLPGRLFMPQGFSQVDLLIENAACSLQLACASAAASAECQGHELVAGQSYLQYSGGGALPVKLSGTWYQMSANAYNRICDLWIEAETTALPAVAVQVAQLEIRILSRELTSADTTPAIILHGTVVAGTLMIDGEEQPSLSGAPIRITCRR